jgi:hypothetical protein
MNNNIRKSPIRFDAVILAFIMLFVGSIGSFGNPIVSDIAPISNDLAIPDFNPIQQHFSVLNNQENLLVLKIEEKDERDTKDVSEDFLGVHQITNTEIFTNNKCLIPQNHIYSFVPKLKKYILFQALKLDC